MQRCKCCKGTGKEIDPKRTGAKLRKLAARKGISSRSLAVHLGISDSYVCELFNGTRLWTDEKLANFEKAIQSLAK